MLRAPKVIRIATRGRLRLETAFFAQAAEAMSDGRLFVHGGGIEGFAFPVFPGVVPSIAIVLRFHFESQECGVNQRIRVTITDPDGGDVGLNAFSEAAPQVPPEFDDRGVNLFNVFTVNNLPFMRAGIYTVNVFGNEGRLGGLSVRVGQDPAPCPWSAVGNVTRDPAGGSTESFGRSLCQANQR